MFYVKMDKSNFERVLLWRSYLIFCGYLENSAFTPYKVNLIHEAAVLSSDMLVGSVPSKYLSVFYY